MEGIELLTFSLLVIIAGGVFVNRMVTELEPQARTRWLLGIAIGSGVVMFTLKVAFAVAFSFYAEDILALLPDKPLGDRPHVILPQLSPGPSNSGTIAYRWEALPQVAPYPADNPPSPAKIALGKDLFFDKRLSIDSSVSCASCHELSRAKGGGDGLRLSVGVAERLGTRNAPTVLNAAFFNRLFWDGRADSLEEQIEGPLLNTSEMAMPSLDAVVERVRAEPSYREKFAAAFGGDADIDFERIAKAIATFERTLITPNTPYDRFVNGDSAALSPQQLRGMALFESTGCVVCHAGPNFSVAAQRDATNAFRIFPAIPGSEYVEQYDLVRDLGRAGDHNAARQGVWRVPSLRNVARTAPYFHNGAVDNLEDAVRIMSRVQLNKRLSNDPSDDVSIHWQSDSVQFQMRHGEALSDTEIADIVAFLQALNGELPAS